MQRGPIATSRDESEHLVTKTDISAANSPATSTATYRNSLNAHDNLGTTDYFPNLIDTSMPLVHSPDNSKLTIFRSVGSESM